MSFFVPEDGSRLQPAEDRDYIFVPEGPAAQMAYDQAYKLGTAWGAVYSERYRATHDALTGLPNRAWLDENLAAEIASHPGDFSLLFADIDGLKLINDTLGHSAGNEMLVMTAIVMQHSLRIDDTKRASDDLAHAATRLAGDEFVMLVRGVSDWEGLETIVGRITTNLEKVGIHASIGGRAHRPGESASELLQAVDKMMYAQKQRRKRERLAALPIGKRIFSKAGLFLQRHSGIPSSR